MENIKFDFEIKKEDFTAEGNIPCCFIEKIRTHLTNKGLIICPSDTCYSVAAMCNHADIGDILNTILEREDMPFSVAVDSVKTVSEYIDSNNTVFLKLLEWFTPGPITCIGVVNDNHRRLCKIIRAEKDETIGVRVPESKIERTIAEVVNFPITTVPVRMGKSTPIKDYNKAVSCIKESLKNKNLQESVKIAGIEANFSFAEKLSTYVCF